MSASWWIEMRAEQVILELREILVRFDENLAAHTLMQECVPYFLDDASHPQIVRARFEQARMVDHIVGESYATYYETNHHERPFEEQYGCSAADAHSHLHRVRFLRRFIEEQDEPPYLLDLACNDGWLAVNLAGLVGCYHGIDLNPHCIERAKGRSALPVFQVGFAEDARRLTNGLRPAFGYDVVVAYELVEHVRDPAKLIDVMVSVCRPGGSLFVSTPLGAGTGGDLPNWWLVEPKGHVRAYTPQTFGALLAPHGETHIEISETQGAGRLMVARVEVPAIVAADDGELSADRAGDRGDPRPLGRSRAAER